MVRFVLGAAGLITKRHGGLLALLASIVGLFQLSRFAIAVGGTAPVADPNMDLVILEYFIAGRPLHIGLYVDKLGALVTTNSQPDYEYSSSGTFFGLQTLTNEQSLQVTLTNFLADIKKLYDSTVNFSIRSVWKRDNNGILQEAFPTAGLGAEAGTGGTQSPVVVTPTDADDGCFIERIITSRTGHGGKFRFSLVGAYPYELAKPQSLAADPNGSTYEKIAGYISSPDSRIQGHAGGKVQSAFRMHATPSAKLRRSFNWA